MTINRKEIPALVEALAAEVAGKDERHKSLKNLCEQAKASPLQYASIEVRVWGTKSEKAVWSMGFCEAMSIVLAYIDTAPRPPSPR